MNPSFSKKSSSLKVGRARLYIARQDALNGMSVLYQQILVVSFVMVICVLIGFIVPFSDPIAEKPASHMPVDNTSIICCCEDVWDS